LIRAHDLPVPYRIWQRKPIFKIAVDRQHFAENSREVGLRVGNTWRRALVTWFANPWPRIVQELQNGERLVEVR
jgi:hypothetical protein